MQNALQGLRERLNAGQVLAGQLLQLPLSELGELEVHATMIDGVAAAADQARALRAPGELDGAVVAYVQLLSRLSDRRPRCDGMAAQNQQQLVKRRRQPGVLGCLLAPAQEIAQLAAERQQPLIVLVEQRTTGDRRRVDTVAGCVRAHVVGSWIGSSLLATRNLSAWAEWALAPALLDQHSLVRLEQVELAHQSHQPLRILPVCDRQHTVSARDHPVGDLTQGLVGERQDRLARQIVHQRPERGSARGKHIGECQHTDQPLTRVEHRIQTLAAIGAALGQTLVQLLCGRL